MATDHASAASREPVDAEVLGSTEIDEGVLRRLLRRAGRTLARPAIECLELLLDAGTPVQVRITMLAALTYLLVPVDLIPDFIPAAGFSDDLVALTALLGLCSTHMSETIRIRAQRKLDRWFPPGR
ncbi:MAG: YkvA family protein [Cyanobium sp.]